MSPQVSIIVPVFNEGDLVVPLMHRHEVEAGDGIRCRIVASRGGLLAQAAVHNRTEDLNVTSVALEAGDTLDFIVDPTGLVVIDGAANHATYDDAPSPAERSAIVGQVVDALGIPRDLFDAAMIDGATDLQAYREIVLPLARPVLSAA